MKLKKIPKIITLVILGIILLTFIDTLIALANKGIPLFSVKKDDTYYSLYYKVRVCGNEYKAVSYFNDTNCEG